MCLERNPARVAVAAAHHEARLRRALAAARRDGDDSGAHIVRTAALAAPMHGGGRIGTPGAVSKKPGVRARLAALALARQGKGMKRAP